MTPEPKTITILSLGAGVQSTALALMAEEGLIEPVVAAALVGKLYVWRGFQPLRTAEFDTAKGQMDFGFEQECDGMCGH